jgi:hypothetical protein
MSTGKHVMTETHLAFHHLTILHEGDEAVIGRPETDSYAVFPKSGAALLIKLQEGMSLSGAAHWYETSEGDPIDMEDFVATLRELGFVRDENAEDHYLDGKPVSLVWLGNALFRPVALACYTLLAAGCAWALATVPEVRPQPRNLFFSNSLLLVEVTLLAGGTIGIGIHEGFHVLAGRRLGLPSRLRVSTRLYFIVFETRLRGLLGVPKRQRYLPFLAGMLADVLLFSVFTLVAAITYHPDEMLPWPGRLALALAYLTMLRLAWQFYFFLRTDLYYVISTMLSCQDLHGAACARLHNLSRRVIFRYWPEVDESAWTERDRRMAVWYAPFLVVGVVILLGMAAVALIPAVLQAFSRVIDGLLAGAAQPHFWDSVAFLILGFAPITVALALQARGWARRRRHQFTKPISDTSSARVWETKL